MNVKHFIISWAFFCISILGWAVSYHLLVNGGLATVQIAGAEPHSLTLAELRPLFAQQSLGTLVGRPLFLSSLVGAYLSAFGLICELWSYAKK